MEQRYKRTLVEEEDLKSKPDQIASVENMLISVSVPNEACVPRQPIPHSQEWAQQSKTLKQVREKCILHIFYTTPITTSTISENSERSRNTVLLTSAQATIKGTTPYSVRVQFVVRTRPVHIWP